MRKVLLKILILAVAIGSFLSPISANLNSNWNLTVQKNEVLAADITPKNFLATADTSKVNLGDIAIDKIIFNVDIDTGKVDDYENFRVAGGVLNVYRKISKESDSEYKVAGIIDLYALKEAAKKTETTKQPVSFKALGLSAETEYIFQLRAEMPGGILSVGTEPPKILATTTAIKTTPLGQGNVSDDQGGATILNGEDFLPKCGVTFGLGDGSVYGCIIQVVYYAFWLPTSWLAGLAGKLLDFFIFYSINSASYNASGFVNEGWKVVRDLANIAFIFVLLYIALQTILGMGSSQAKKMIGWVVGIALLINFSLFFTKIIVDSGNILANVLYNDIGARAQKNGEVIGTVKGDFGEKGISASLVSQFDPQKIIQNANVKENIENIKTPILVIVVLATIVNIFMITTFLSIMFLFVGRVVGLMFSMIFSPFAFMSLTLPGSAGKIMKQWSWDAWLSELLNATFMAPIFIFFLWLILLFLNVNDGILFAGIQKSIGFGEGGGQILTNFIAVIAPFVLIIGLLTKAKEITASMAGEVATKLSGVAKSAVGYLGGAALGGAAFLGRATVGRLASSVATGGGTAGGAAAGAGTVTRPPIVPSLSGLQGINKITARARSAAAEITERERAQREGIPTIAGSERPARTAPTITYGAKDFLKEERERIENERAGIPPIGQASTSVTPGVSRFLGGERQKIEAAQALRAGIATATTPILRTTPTTATSTARTSTTAGTTPETSTTPEKQPAQGAETAGDAAAKQATETARRASEEKARQAKSLKDMAASAPKSIFDLIKSKQKGEDVKNILGKQAFSLAKYLGSASFDMRDTKLFKYMSKESGLDFGKAGGKGGFEKMQEEIIKNEVDYAKKLSATGKELEHINKLKSDLVRAGGKDKAPELHAQIEAEEKLIKAKNAARQMTYAERVEKGGGLFGYTPTQLEAAQKIRGLSKEKQPKDKIADLINEQIEALKKSDDAAKPKEEPPVESKPAGDAGSGKK